MCVFHPMIISLNWQNFLPCNGFVTKSAYILSVGQCSMDIFHCFTLSIIQFFMLNWCKLLTQDNLPFFAIFSSFDILIKCDFLFFVLCASIKWSCHMLYSIYLLLPINLVLLVLCEFIFCFVHFGDSISVPKEINTPVWPHISGCTAWDELIKVSI